MFLLDLELRTMSLYFQAIRDFKLFSSEPIACILQTLETTSSYLNRIRGKLLFAIKRNRKLDEQQWREAFTNIYRLSSLLCTQILNLLKNNS